MALFKSNPEKTMQRDIDAAKANRDRLSAKLAETETAIIARRSAAQALARDGADDALLEKAEAAIRAAQDRAATIAGAVADVVQQLGALEQTKIENADRKLRSETAAQVAAMAVDLEQAAASFDIAVAALSDIAGRAAIFIPDAIGLEAFSASSREQVPPAVELVAVLMRNHAAAVLNGSAAATLQKAETVAPVTKQAIHSAKIFTTKPVKFLDTATNAIKTWPAFHELNLPAHLATRALALKAAVPITHEIAKRSLLKGGGNAFEWPDAARCVSLDSDSSDQSQSPHEPVLHSAFEQLDRGRPFIVKTAGPAHGEAA